MIDKELKVELNEMEKIDFSLRQIIFKLYYKSQEMDLDSDTSAFLINISELLQSCRLKLKDVDVDIIRNFIPSSPEKTRLLCDTVTQRDKIEDEYKQMQISDVKFFQETDIKSDLISSRKN